MNKYYKFYSVEYDTEHENVTIYISMDGEHWVSVMDFANFDNAELPNEEVEQLLEEQDYKYKED